MNNLTKVFCGVDISKESLDIHFFPLGKSMVVKNTKEGMDKLIKELKKHDIKKIGCESTGGYEKLFLKTLRNNGYKPRVIDPKRIKAFIIACGIKIKTDKIDAKMIAEFLSKNEDKYDAFIKTETQEKMAALVNRRNDLVKMRASEQVRLDHPIHESSYSSIKKIIKVFDREIKTLDDKINGLIDKDDTLKKKSDILRSVPGIGPIAVSTLLSHLPELGMLEKEEISALIGLSPYNYESGNFIGRRFIRGGRQIPRRILFMNCVTAIRYDGVFKDFYERLRNKGKSFKVAIVAVMHKMTIILNTLIKKGETYRAGNI